MYHTIIGHDYMKSEIDYRRDRIRGELAGSRRRRSIIRRGAAGESTFGPAR